MHQHRYANKVIFWICLSTITPLLNAEDYADQNKDDIKYKYKYLIRDDNTGDYKTQEETKVGDTVKGRYTVAEPNGDLRVVTYAADQYSGFRAHVQIHPGGSPMKKIIEQLRSRPRHIRRTELKSQNPRLLKLAKEESTANTSTILQTRNTEQSEYVPKLANQEGDFHQAASNKITEMQIDRVNIIKNNSQFTDDSKPDKGAADLMILSFKKEKRDTENSKTKKQDQNEGRAHIRPDEDKVQFEMEQVIRAEMRDPTTVKLGVPLEEHMNKYSQQTKYHRPSQYSEEIHSSRAMSSLLKRDLNNKVLYETRQIPSDRHSQTYWSPDLESIHRPQALFVPVHFQDRRQQESSRLIKSKYPIMTSESLIPDASIYNSYLAYPPGLSLFGTSHYVETPIERDNTKPRQSYL